MTNKITVRTENQIDQNTETKNKKTEKQFENVQKKYKKTS